MNEIADSANELTFASTKTDRSQLRQVHRSNGIGVGCYPWQGQQVRKRVGVFINIAISSK
jgi:hypothetical protein